MDLNKQITKVADIKKVVEALQSSCDLLNSAVVSLAGVGVKLTLDFSTDCTECGQFAGFIKDCRDKLVADKMLSLVGFMNCITRLQYAINPDVQTLNSDYIKQMDAAKAQQDQEQNN
jgi:hypothetical protein